jgi:hypothetical protein
MSIIFLLTVIKPAFPAPLPTLAMVMILLSIFYSFMLSCLPIMKSIGFLTVIHFARCFIILRGCFRPWDSKMESKIELKVLPTSAQVANGLMPKAKSQPSMLR